MQLCPFCTTTDRKTGKVSGRQATRGPGCEACMKAGKFDRPQVDPRDITPRLMTLDDIAPSHREHAIVDRFGVVRTINKTTRNKY